jgi:FtsZ-interacting cell division protein ZipA
MIELVLIAIIINVFISAILFFGLWSLRNEMAEEIEFIKKTTTLGLETDKELLDAMNKVVSFVLTNEEYSQSGEVNLELVQMMMDNVYNGDIN